MKGLRSNYCIIEGSKGGEKVGEEKEVTETIGHNPGKLLGIEENLHPHM